MRALTIRPRQRGSLELTEHPRPEPAPYELLIETLAVGICGTDHELAEGQYGEAPGGDERLVIGHESLGRVRAAPEGSPFEVGQLVCGIVRRPDPAPCSSCAAGEWDMCENGRFTERGIKQRHGFASDWFTLEPEFAVLVPESLGICGVLLEPASIVAKVWEQIERIAARSTFRPRRVLVTGAGSIGLLAALMAAQRGFELHVLDRAEAGPKVDLVRSLGATYHCDEIGALRNRVDVVVECTGAPEVVADAVPCTGPNGIVCLAGVSSGARTVQLNASQLNNELVMQNSVVFGSVNANRRHFEKAVEALQQAPAGWLARMITREVPVERFRAAFETDGNDIKTVLRFDARSAEDSRRSARASEDRRA